MGKRILWRLLLLCLLLAPSTGHCWIHGAQPLDLLMSESDVIVKVLMNDFLKEEYERFSFRATILKIIKEDSLPIPQEQKFETFGSSAYPFTKFGYSISPCVDQPAILFLERGSDNELWIINDASAMLPVSSEKIPIMPATGTREILFNELKLAADSNTDPMLKAQFVSFLARLATNGDLDVLISYLADPDPWVHRASLLGVAQIDPRQERIQAVVEDLNRWSFDLSNVAYYVREDVFGDVEYVSRCRAFGMNESMAARARIYLPIYRALLDNASRKCGDDPVTTPFIGMCIEALSGVGTREDIMRLYAFRLNKRASLRHNVLEGLGRILGRPVKRPRITTYPDDGSVPQYMLAWEVETLAMLEGLMKAEGFI